MLPGANCVHEHGFRSDRPKEGRTTEETNIRSSVSLSLSSSLSLVIVTFILMLKCNFSGSYMNKALHENGFMDPTNLEGMRGGVGSFTYNRIIREWAFKKEKKKKKKTTTKKKKKKKQHRFQQSILITL